MDESSFDALTKRLFVAPIERRGAIRRLFGAALGLAAGQAALGDSRAKKKRRKKRGRRRKKPSSPGSGCTPDCAGKNCGGDGCGGSCGACNNGFTCSDNADGGTCRCPSGACNGVCCGGNQTCVAGTCCATSRVCGNACCTGNQTCLDSSCCPNAQACNGACCPANQQCVSGACCPTSRVCNGSCCTGDRPCVNGQCCPSARVCGNVCCNTSQSCVSGQCCASGRVCNGACCGSNATCIAGQCCPDARACGSVCCAANQQCVSGSCRAGYNPDAEELAFLTLINDYRRDNGHSPLALQDQLGIAAELHSQDQADRDRGGHDGSDGSNAGQRITRAGYDWSAWGENVFWSRPDGSAQAAFNWWRDSPSHNANMLSANFTEIGIGRARSASGWWYWTTVFARPR